MQGAPAPHQKVPVFPGCQSATRCTAYYALHFRVTQHPLWLTRLGIGEELPEVAQTFQRQPHEPVNPHAC